MVTLSGPVKLAEPPLLETLVLSGVVAHQVLNLIITPVQKMEPGQEEPFIQTMDSINSLKRGQSVTLLGPRPRRPPTWPPETPSISGPTPVASAPTPANAPLPEFSTPIDESDSREGRAEAD